MSHSLPTLDPELLCGLTSALDVDARSVDVWAFSLSAPLACLDQCQQSLCATERSRAARFIHPQTRNDYVVAHGVLRQLLGRYTAVPPGDLAFALGPNGKPRLETPCANGKLVSFNMSHSHGRAVVAISDGREIGVDLEKIEPNVRALAIARRYFCATELSAIESAAAPLQAQTFYRYWVAKEAALKGQGIGLVFPIDRFEVQFAAQDSTAQISARGASQLSGDWTIQMLPVEVGWMGAVAARGGDWMLTLKGAADAS